MRTYLPTRSGGFLLGSARKHSENFFFLHDEEVFAVNLDLGSRVFAEQDAIALFNCQGEYFAVFVAAALSYGDDFAFLRFVFCAVGDDDSASSRGRLFHAANQDAVMQRGELCSHAYRLL